jgi:hypothetical protein
MASKNTAVTPERFAMGMTFAEYVNYVGTPENLEREAGWWLGPQRRDFSALLRDRYERARLGEAQVGAVRWLASAMRAPRPGETPEQAWARFLPEWGALQHSPFFDLWASAMVDEVLSALHDRLDRPNWCRFRASPGD